MNRCTTTLLLVLVTAACGGDAVPTPTAPTSSGSPAPSTVNLRGFVNDTAFRAVAGALVEILDGSLAGTSTTTDSGGSFAFSGAFTGSVTLRATKEGFAAETRSFDISPGSSTQVVGLSLKSLAPPVGVVGEYFLTVTADSACVELPEDVRTRRYEATIRPTSVATSFQGTVGGASFLGSFNRFFVGVTGDYVSINVDFDGPTIVEQVAERTYLSIDGLGGGSVEASRLSTIDIPFDALIDYCVLKTESPPTSYSGCVRADQTVAQSHCLSTNNRLTLTRR